MGAYITQELMLARPELVSQAVLMATFGRRDRLREFFYKAEIDLGDTKLPPSYLAKTRLMENFSPKTLNDDDAVRDWIDIFTMWPIAPTPGLRAQRQISPDTNRLATYRSIATPTLVIGFADDLLLPSHLSREVAAALPNGRYMEFRDAGHLGFLERPKVVNSAILEFFAGKKL